MSTVTIVDYGASNLLNVVHAFEHCGARVEVTNHAATISKAERLVLPGVGAFGDCSKALATLGIDRAIVDYVQSDRLFLGICVGMQVMFEAGEEFGMHKGLGIIPGKVALIPSTGKNGAPHKIPHIGWNTLLRAPGTSSWKGTLLEPLEQIDGGVAAYFVHSFMGIPTDPSHRLANVDYNGIAICAAVRKGNAYGCQFHPEKSGEHGLTILKTFLTL